jgi:alkanesulfonate monooxygenase SsuD/methylene tetrahydromethanopterin reductase-like flavin-dependent oxidoreductase (luciferase family)
MFHRHHRHRDRALAAISCVAVHAAEVGFNIYAIGEHHKPPFIS